jgi:predicted AlkP superfamily phosphohydrolase/phosphomutase
MTPVLVEGKKLFELKIALSADLTYAGSCLYLMDRYDVDFVSPYIEGVDIMQHLFWKYAYPDSSLYDVDEADVRNLGGVIRTYHVMVDSLLGEFMKRSRPTDYLVVASDHGFQPSNVRQHIHISGEHERKGLLLMTGPGVRESYLLEGVDVMDMTPMILYMMDMPVARDMTGSVPLAAFTEEFTRNHQPVFIDTYEKEVDRPTDIKPIPSPVDSDLLDKLEALGYISRD